MEWRSGFYAGSTVYLGAYDEEEAEARAYDLAMLKYWGKSTFNNFPIPEYENEIEVMQNMTKERWTGSSPRNNHCHPGEPKMPVTARPAPLVIGVQGFDGEELKSLLGGQGQRDGGQEPITTNQRG